MCYSQAPSVRIPAGGRLIRGRRGGVGPQQGWSGLLARQPGDAHPLLGACLVLEVDGPVHGCENCVVVAEARALAGLERHAALPDDDGAGRHELAVAGLDAETLADAVAAVLRARSCLLVGHLYSSFLVRARFFGASASGARLASVFDLGSAFGSALAFAGFAAL